MPLASFPEMYKMWSFQDNFFFFQSLYLPNFYMNTLTILHFTQHISILRTQSRHYPNPIATNGAGVCQYDITNATANYNTVSMATLGHQFKDKQIIIATWMHHIYSKKNWQKGARNLERFMGPITVEQVHLYQKITSAGGAGATGIRYIHVLSWSR